MRELQHFCQHFCAQTSAWIYVATGRLPYAYHVSKLRCPTVGSCKRARWASI